MKIQPVHLHALAVVLVASAHSSRASAEPPAPADIPFDTSPVAPAAPAPPSSGAGMRVGGWISFGAGVATLAAGITCFAAGNADYREARDQFVAGQNVSHDELHAVDHWMAGGVALSAVGVLAMGAGVTFVLLAPGRNAAPAASFGFSPRGALVKAVF